MKQRSRSPVLLVLAVVLMVWAGSAAADEQVNGTVKSVDLTTHTVVVTSYEGADVVLTVEDELTLNKLKAGKIRVDDDVKVKYDKVNGRNVPTYFRKPAGC
jgi:lipopolysaccharide export system protein LptC